MRIIRQFLRGFQLGMQNFGKIITAVVNTILLSLVYILGVGITAILAKMTGKKFLNLVPTKKNSYWTNLNLKKKSIEEYYRQF
jgi:cytochrome c biogenesis protein CcdA